MSTILILTVGGASAPLVGSISTYSPDYVVFITSKDQLDRKQSGSYMMVDTAGEPCDVRPEVKCPACKAVVTARQSKPAIVVQAGLSAEQYVVHQVEADDLNDAYVTIRRVLAELRRDNAEARLLADYTGGTKTMSAALALAALERGDCELTLMTGARSNLQRVDEGTELATAVDTLGWRARRRISIAEELFDQYDYRAAQTTLEELAREMALPPALRNDVQQRVRLCRGFDAWDCFDHQAAQNLLQPFAKQLGAHFQTLLALNGKTKNSGYEQVHDLMRNAERRADRGRYDDAVARLYRTAELLAQIRLELQYNLQTSDILVERLPEALRATYSAGRGDDGKIRLGLQAAYALLSNLNDPLGAIYEQQRKPLGTALTVRNHSILAHGRNPVGAAGYQELSGLVNKLIEVARDVLRLGKSSPQFPPLREILG